MVIELPIGVPPAVLQAFATRPIAEVIREINAQLAAEGKKHFGAGRITIGQLADGRFYFHHVAIGRLVHCPDEFSVRATKLLRDTILPAVHLLPLPNTERIDGLHGIWCRDNWLAVFLANERVTVDAEAVPA